MLCSVVLKPFAITHTGLYRLLCSSYMYTSAAVLHASLNTLLNNVCYQHGAVLQAYGKHGVIKYVELVQRQEREEQVSNG
jgi:hypothetical protein